MKTVDMYDLAALRAAIDRGETFEYVLFWGHRQKKPGVPDAACFSQWFPARFEVDGETFVHTEQWMMAGKARLFGDEEIRAQIMAERDPGKVKKLGRRVRGFTDDRWAAHRFDLVVAGNEAKFGQNRGYGDYLRSTGNKVLVEASPYDPIWGIGLSREAPDATNPHGWVGDNLLGFALMVVRDRLRDA